MANQVATAIQATLSDPQQRDRLLAAPPGPLQTPSFKAPTRPCQNKCPDFRPGPLGLHCGSAQRDELANARCACPRNGNHRPVDGPESAVQHLAGIVAAQSGDREVFRATPTSIPGAETLAAWKVAQPLTTPANAPVATSSRARDEVHRGAQGLWLQSRGRLRRRRQGIRPRPGRLIHRQRRSAHRPRCRDECRNCR